MLGCHGDDSPWNCAILAHVRLAIAFFGSGVEIMVRSPAQKKTHRGCRNGNTHSCRLATEHPTPSSSFWRGMRCRCYSTVERMKWNKSCCIHRRLKPVWRYANMDHQCFVVRDLLFRCRRCHSLNRGMPPLVITEKCRDAEGLCLACYQYAKLKDLCIRCFLNLREREPRSRSRCTP